MLHCLYVLEMLDTELDPFPDLREFLGLSGPIDDPLYEIRCMFGIEGAWERLCLILTFNQALEGVGDGSSKKHEPEMRAEFESQLGRAFTAREWDSLYVLAGERAKKNKLSLA
jgi:hypothetical protein